ncbi:hypothetical protein Moror_5331 [Moniliophthora roreri MCA 2997]|uniref:Uncharacterized protein n=2 Tax=Moniliophthora roreri TaxID=221103 RepID=V2X8D7_MONRO|nr:hypothetical protein Moror_5331 [Moniliophthora roreri MCA 2997]KAI3618209.1 hypothetical protein WG66_005623 [Moniliophthora roreri]
MNSTIPTANLNHITSTRARIRKVRARRTKFAKKNKRNKEWKDHLSRLEYRAKALLNVKYLDNLEPASIVPETQLALVWIPKLHAVPFDLEVTDVCHDVELTMGVEDMAFDRSILADFN